MKLSDIMNSDFIQGNEEGNFYSVSEHPFWFGIHESHFDLISENLEIDLEEFVKIRFLEEEYLNAIEFFHPSFLVKILNKDIDSYFISDDAKIEILEIKRRE